MNMKTISYQYRYEKNTGVIFLVYVNLNDRKKWYECYDVYNNQHFNCDKEYLLTKTTPLKSSNYVELTNILLKNDRIYKNCNIINRLPKL